MEIEAGQTRVYSGNYSAYALKKAQLRDAQYKAYLNQQRDIKHQEAVIAKLKSFKREKSIKRAESRDFPGTPCIKWKRCPACGGTLQGISGTDSVLRYFF